jgi:hypothetical protein
MDNFVVYAYCREDGTFYYIGKGRPRRPYGKRKEGVKPPKDRSRILILHEGLSEQLAFSYEEKLILFYGRKDLGTGLLRNMTNGGEGTAGWIPTEQWIKAQRKKKRPDLASWNRKNPKSGEDHPMYGQSRPDLASRNKEDCPSKGTKWFNNGEIDKRFHPGNVPEGFVPGRLNMGRKSPKSSLPGG